MTFRTVNGNDYTEDGWRCVELDECDIVRIPELYLTETAPLRKGAPLIILGAWLYWYDRNVEEIDSSVWGWSQDNAVLGQPGRNNGSNHLSATAVDVNAPKYPWGANTMSQDKIDKVEAGLRLFSLDGEESGIFWGRWWDYPDEMHYQMAWPEGDSRNDILAQKLLDGYLGIYKKPESVDLTSLLADLMGNNDDVDYSEYVDGFVRCCKELDCTYVDEIAMLGAQVGHESLGLYYSEEIWGPTPQQLTYQGRMGNDQPGDGFRYRGRDFLQVTGKNNYRALSQWAFDNGITDSPTFFVDNPDELATSAYAFVGVMWYWEAHNLNNYSGNINEATRIINGGYTNIDDRRARYRHGLEMGDRLLAFITPQQNSQPPNVLEEVMSQLEPWISRSMFADSARPVGFPLDALLNTDGNAWNLVNVLGVLLGVPYCVEQVQRMAKDDFPAGTAVADDPWLRKIATDFAKSLAPLAGSLAKFLKAVNEQTTGDSNVKSDTDTK